MAIYQNKKLLSVFQGKTPVYTTMGDNTKTSYPYESSKAYWSTTNAHDAKYSTKGNRIAFMPAPYHTVQPAQAELISRTNTHVLKYDEEMGRVNLDGDRGGKKLKEFYLIENSTDEHGVHTIKGNSISGHAYYQRIPLMMVSKNSFIVNTYDIGTITPERRNTTEYGWGGADKEVTTIGRFAFPGIADKYFVASSCNGKMSFGTTSLLSYKDANSVMAEKIVEVKEDAPVIPFYDCDDYLVTESSTGINAAENFVDCTKDYHITRSYNVTPLVKSLPLDRIPYSYVLDTTTVWAATSSAAIHRLHKQWIVPDGDNYFDTYNTSEYFYANFYGEQSGEVLPASREETWDKTGASYATDFSDSSFGWFNGSFNTSAYRYNRMIAFDTDELQNDLNMFGNEVKTLTFNIKNSSNETVKEVSLPYLEISEPIKEIVMRYKVEGKMSYYTARGIRYIGGGDVDSHASVACLNNPSLAFSKNVDMTSTVTSDDAYYRRVYEFRASDINASEESTLKILFPIEFHEDTKPDDSEWVNNTSTTTLTLLSLHVQKKDRF